MHGGASRSGATAGNRNAFKHGLYTQEMIAHRKLVNEVLRQGRRALIDYGDE